MSSALPTLRSVLLIESTRGSLTSRLYSLTARRVGVPRAEPDAGGRGASEVGGAPSAAGSTPSLLSVCVAAVVVLAFGAAVAGPLCSCSSCSSFRRDATKSFFWRRWVVFSVCAEV